MLDLNVDVMPHHEEKSVRVSAIRDESAVTLYVREDMTVSLGYSMKPWCIFAATLHDILLIQVLLTLPLAILR